MGRSLLGRLRARLGPHTERTGAPVVALRVLAGAEGSAAPALMALLERMAARGLRPQVVATGAGTPRRIGPEARVEEVGAEALLLSAFAPVWISGDAADGVRAAAEAEAGAVLLARGEGVAADLTVLLARAGDPAPRARALRGAGLLLAVGPAETRQAFAAGLPPGAPPVQGAALAPLATGMPWAGIRALAFAAEPGAGAFFAALRATGATVVAERPLEAGAPPSPALLQRLEAEAARLVGQPVTGETEALRLPPGMRARVLTLPLRLSSDDWGPLDRALGALQDQGSARS